MERVFYWWKIKSANELAQIRSIPMIPILVKYRMKLFGGKKTPVTSLDPLKTVPLCSKLVSSPSLQGSADTTCVPKHQRDFVLEIYLCEHTSYSGHRIELCWLAHSRWVQCEFRMRICGALSLSLSIASHIHRWFNQSHRSFFIQNVVSCKSFAQRRGKWVPVCVKQPW